MSNALLDMAYDVILGYPDSKARSGIARPVSSVITFLRFPFLSKGRNAFVVRIGPRTLLVKEVLRSAVNTSGEGL
jgi:hypothetical protein